MRTINGIYVVKDDAVGAFGNIVYFFSTHAEAERNMKLLIQRGAFQDIAAAPGYYHLYCLGEVDLDTGKITPTEPQLVAHFAGMLGGSEDGQKD